MKDKSEELNKIIKKLDDKDKINERLRAVFVYAVEIEFLKKVYEV